MSDETFRKYFDEMVENERLEDLGQYTPRDLSKKLRAYLINHTGFYCNAKQCLEITEGILKEMGIRSSG